MTQMATSELAYTDSTQSAVRHAAWQFRLWHVFALTTYAAVAAALVRVFGAGILVTCVGILIAGLSSSGALSPLQSRRLQKALLCLAWTFFLVSLALPSVVIFGPTVGAMAAWAAVALPANALVEGEALDPAILLFLGFDLANLLMLLLPLLVWRLSRGRGHVLSAALFLTMVAPWWAATDAQLLIGFYVWSASFMLVALAIRVSTSVLIAMICEAIGLSLLTMF